MPQLFGGSWWIRKPRSKKQSAGLFFAVCGRPTCSNPTSSSTKKNPQPKLRVLFVSTLQKGCPGNQPFVLYTHQPFSRHFFNFLLLTSPAKMRLAVAVETLHNARTSAFIINGWSHKYARITFQRSTSLLGLAGAALIPPLISSASMSDALIDASINSTNAVDSPAYSARLPASRESSGYGFPDAASGWPKAQT